MKLSAFALAAVLLAGVAAPALASSDDPQFDGSFLTTALQQKGVNAVAVYENSDNIVRAVIQARPMAAKRSPTSTRTRCSR